MYGRGYGKMVEGEEFIERMKKILATLAEGTMLSKEIDKMADGVEELFKDITKVKIEEIRTLRSYIAQGNLLIEDIMAAREKDNKEE